VWLWLLFGFDSVAVAVAAMVVEALFRVLMGLPTPMVPIT
jgi:hypothetical protein